MKKNFIAAAVICAAFCAASAAQAADLKIAYVDIQKVVAESAAGKSAGEKFKGDIKKAEDSLMKEKNSVEKLGETLEKQSAMLSEDSRREKEKDFLRRKRDYERLLKDQQTELQIKEAELKNEILESLLPIIQKYGKDNGFSIIFGKSDVMLLYASETLDLTDKIVALYDEEYKTKPQKEKAKK
jgi:outer membrane protein